MFNFNGNNVARSSLNINSKNAPEKECPKILRERFKLTKSGKRKELLTNNYL
jgi:hypothetical protein